MRERKCLYTHWLVILQWNENSTSVHMDHVNAATASQNMQTKHVYGKCRYTFTCNV